MIFNLLKLQEGKKFPVTYKPNFDGGDYKKIYPLDQILDVEVTVTFLEFEDILTISFEGKASVILICSYTGDKFNTEIKLNEDLEFSFNKDDPDLDYIGDNMNINVDDYVFAILSSSIPMEVHKPGAKLPTNGSGYRVLFEEESNKEKEEKLDPRFACLDDLDLD